MEAHPRPNTHRITRTLAATFLAWWVGLAVIWLLLVDTIDPEELLVGAVAASLAASVAVAIHHRGSIRFRPRARWAREVPHLVWDVAVDCGVLAGALWRHVALRRPIRGETIRVPFHHGGDNGRDGARRALANFAVSLTPNSYVVDIDPESDSLLVHRLVPVALDRILVREQRRAGEANLTHGQGADA